MSQIQPREEEPFVMKFELLCSFKWGTKSIQSAPIENVNAIERRPTNGYLDLNGHLDLNWLFMAVVLLALLFAVFLLCRRSRRRTISKSNDPRSRRSSPEVTTALQVEDLIAEQEDSGAGDGAVAEAVEANVPQPIVFQQTAQGDSEELDVNEELERLRGKDHCLCPKCREELIQITGIVRNPNRNTRTEWTRIDSD